MRSVHLWPEETKLRDGVVVSAVSIEAPGRERARLWYELPEEQRSHVPAHADHLVVGVAFLVMQLGLNVHVHGQVTPSLIRNLAEFHAAWTQILPGLESVNVRADIESEVDLPPGRKGALVSFSGGVDSCFTAFRHARGVGVRHPRSVAAAVMVHGFDIPLGEPGIFARALERAARISSSLGLELIPVATNYRDVVTDWAQSHGAAVASCLALLGGGFSEGLIGQTFTYGEIRQISEGVNALTDPLLSSEFFRIVPDGAGFERSEKIRLLGGWKEFRRDVRVCWEGPKKDRNCCVCEKCIRNILTFRALGLDLPSAFERDVDEKLLRSLSPGPEVRATIRYGSLAKIAEESGAAGPWVKTLEKRLAAVRRARTSRVVRMANRARYYAGRAVARLKGEPRFGQ